MIKNQPQAQHQQMNLGLNEAGLFNDRESNNYPVFVVNCYSQQIREMPQYQNGQQGNLKATKAPVNQNQPKQKKRKRNNKDESRLKAYYADELIQCIADQRISYEVASYQMNMPLDVLLELSKGNVGRASLYEILSGITKFGYEARICMLPTHHRGAGTVMADR